MNFRYFAVFLQVLRVCFSPQSIFILLFKLDHFYSFFKFTDCLLCGLCYAFGPLHWVYLLLLYFFALKFLFYFFIYIDIFLVLCMMSEFLFKSEYFRYCVIRLWMWFKTSVLLDFLWYCSDRRTGSTKSLMSGRGRSQFPHLAIVDTGWEEGILITAWQG